MESIILRWAVKYSSIKNVIIQGGEVLIQTTGGKAIYKFNEYRNEKLINKLIKNLPQEKVIFVKDESFMEFNKLICDIYNQDYRIVYCRGRKREIVQSRQMAMALAKIRTKKTYTEIGLHYGGFDNATVLYAVKTVKNLIETNKKINKEIGHLFEGITWPHFKN